MTDVADNTSRRATLRGLGDGFVGVWVAFEDKNSAKALPGARWDSHLKGWGVPDAFRRDAQRLVDKLNDGLDVELADALLTVFKRLPTPLRQPTYRGLSKLWHPDTGGDLRAQQALAGAWAEVGS